MQSTVLAHGRQELVDREQRLLEQYADEGKPVPRPPHWGGFLVRPLAVEFWQGRKGRLHDRLRYRRSSVERGAWELERLSP